MKLHFLYFLGLLANTVTSNKGHRDSRKRHGKRVSKISFKSETQHRRKWDDVLPIDDAGSSNAHPNGPTVKSSADPAKMKVFKDDVLPIDHPSEDHSQASTVKFSADPAKMKVFKDDDAKVLSRFGQEEDKEQLQQGFIKIRDEINSIINSLETEKQQVDTQSHWLKTDEEEGEDETADEGRFDVSSTISTTPFTRRRSSGRSLLVWPALILLLLLFLVGIAPVLGAVMFFSAGVITKINEHNAHLYHPERYQDKTDDSKNEGYQKKPEEHDQKTNDPTPQATKTYRAAISNPTLKQDPALRLTSDPTAQPNETNREEPNNDEEGSEQEEGSDQDDEESD